MKLLAALLLLLGLAWPGQAHAQDIKIGPCDDTVAAGGRISVHPCSPGGGAFVGSCLQSRNFLARVTGFTVADKHRYDSLICGLESNILGCSNTLDALYVFAAPNEAAALLNLCGTDGTLTKNGAVTFQANRGFTGDGTTGYLSNAVLPPNYVKYTLNSASIGGCITNSRTTANDGYLLGTSNASVESFIFPLFSTSNLRWSLNHTVGLGTATTQANAQGFYHLSRIDSSNATIYKDGAQAATGSLSGDAVPTVPFYIGALNNNSAAANFSSDQIAVAFIGRGMDSTEVQAFYLLWGSTFGDPLGIPGC